MKSCYQGPNELGIDESGRGTLCGPVAIGGVILPVDFSHPLIIDSKKLSLKQRIEAIRIIKDNALYMSVILVSPDIIDEINITNAVMLGAHTLITESKPSMILMDGNHFKHKLDIGITGETISTNIQYACIVGGDNKYHSIAAASIIAKTYRDEYMTEMSKIYPGYGWDSNFGYGTKRHYDGITEFGITPIHRLSFLRKELATISDFNCFS